MIVNKAMFERLPANIQKAVLDASEAAEKRGWELSKTADEGYKKQMREKGMTIAPVKPDIEKYMQQEARAVVQEYLGTLPPNAKSVLEKFAAR